MIIDHDPEERALPPKEPPHRSLFGKWWWATWAMVAIGWALQFRHGFDWDQICLGILTGCVLVAWSVDMNLSSGDS